MPELFDGPAMTGQVRRELHPGDVLMVKRRVSKAGKRPWIWSLFMVVTKHKRSIVAGRVVGGNGYYAENEYMFRVGDESTLSAHYLPMEEWPDGIHALRMAMVLRGEIPNIV